LVVASEAGDLAAAGAKDLVLFDVPDLGVTPQITALGSPAASAAATALSAYFDEQVLIDLAPVEAAGLTVFDLNTYALLDKAVQDPSAFGFSNVTGPCWTGGFTGSATGGSLCSTLPAVQDTYLFWDDVHPTAAGQLLVADAALSAMAYPCPSPRPGRCSSSALVGWVLRDIARGLARRRESIRIRTPCLKGRLGAAFLLSRLHFVYEKQNSCYLITRSQLHLRASQDGETRSQRFYQRRRPGKVFYLNRP
jgi:GDSL-like Lipase/Acylhydrolase